MSRMRFPAASQRSRVSIAHSLRSAARSSDRDSDFDGAQFAARQIENVVDDLEQMAAALQDVARISPVALGRPKAPKSSPDKISEKPMTALSGVLSSSLVLAKKGRGLGRVRRFGLLLGVDGVALFTHLDLGEIAQEEDGAALARGARDDAQPPTVGRFAALRPKRTHDGIPPRADPGCFAVPSSASRHCASIMRQRAVESAQPAMKLGAISGKRRATSLLAIAILPSLSATMTPSPEFSTASRKANFGRLRASLLACHFLRRCSPA